MNLLSTEEKPLTLKDETGEDIPLVIADQLGIKYDHDKKKIDDYKSQVHKLFSRRDRSGENNFWALKNISFSGYPGEVIGIIGSNGAGKTTLCRVLAGLLHPDRGRMEVNGKISTLLSLGTGFNKELSGRENILLNGMMLGLSRKEILKLLPAIEDFCGIGSYIERPIRQYSTGMKARLGFSIASALEAEILVIDEVLSTGDLEFTKRAAKKMKRLVEKSGLVLIVSHNMSFVEKNCSRLLWIDRGVLKADGFPTEVIEQYKEEMSKRADLKKKPMLSLPETTVSASEKEVLRANNLGVCFKKGKEDFWALKNISFKLYEKEILAIIGPNGAGKTTLCRTLYNLYRPDEGSLSIQGKVTALLSFGTGFNTQLSGRDNIYLNGMMLGVPRSVIRKIEKDVIDFSGLDIFIDKPVKHYSSGMKSRLGFSIATMLKPDIFIIDEALAAGDYVFQEKAAIKMQEMLNDAKAVIIVTHSLKIVEKVCTRAILISRGSLEYDGEPKKAIQVYRKMVKKKDQRR